jgi:hypothetical protein
MTAIGATSPLPCVPAIVPSQSGLQTFTVVRCKPPVRRVGDLRPGKPPESKLNGGEGNEGAQGFGKILEVFGKTTVASEPGESALDHPAARQDDEAMFSLRLTISVRSGGTFATATSTCQAL